MGEFRVSESSLPRKMTHLSDDKTVAKMRHPIVVVRSDVGDPSRWMSVGARMVQTSAKMGTHPASIGKNRAPTYQPLLRGIFCVFGPQILRSFYSL
jgi:hypothetical protein